MKDSIFHVKEFSYLLNATKGETFQICMGGDNMTFMQYRDGGLQILHSI